MLNRNPETYNEIVHLKKMLDLAKPLRAGMAHAKHTIKLKIAINPIFFIFIFSLNSKL